jgi:soluble lytic murein transglycosylase-like protein
MQAMLSRLPQMLERIATIEARLEQVRAHDPIRPPHDDFATALTDATAHGARPAPSSTSTSFDGIIQRAAAASGISADLVHAVVRAESDYNPSCRSSAGAMGLMQLMPGTARGLGVSDPWDPEQNVLGGARYLRQQLDHFGDIRLALAAYNAGPGAVQRHGGVPPYQETQTYVRRVMGYLQERGGAIR